MLLTRGYRIRSVGPVKLKKISKANTEMQITVIIASSVVGCGLYLKPANTMNSFNHAIILPGGPRPRKWTKGYIRIGTLVPPPDRSSARLKLSKKRAPHWEALKGRYR